MNKKPILAVLVISFVFIVFIGIKSYNLKNAEMKIERLKREINGKENKLNEKVGRISKLENNITGLESNITGLEKKLSKVKYRKETLQDRKNLLLSKTERFEKSKVMKEITDKQLAVFLEENEVEYNDYELDDDDTIESDEYVCTDFSTDMVADAREKGIDMCLTSLYYEGTFSGHSIVAVNTETGIKYIEPQSDEIYNNLEVGDQYNGEEISKIVSCFEK